MQNLAGRSKQTENVLELLFHIRHDVLVTFAFSLLLLNHLLEFIFSTNQLVRADILSGSKVSHANRGLCSAL